MNRTTALFDALALAAGSFDRAMREVGERLDRALARWQRPSFHEIAFEMHRESRNRQRFAPLELVVLEPLEPRAPRAPLLPSTDVLRRRTCTRSV